MTSTMITGSWNDVKLVCTHRHEEPIPMILQEGKTLFYACPKYHTENREEEERACNNRLSLEDYTKMLEHLHNKILDAELNDEHIILTNYTWKDRKGTELTVLEHNGSKMTIGVMNKRAIKS